jgi:hypothetical protein
VRLTPGTALDVADNVLSRAETIWRAVRGSGHLYGAYVDAVRDTCPTLKQVFLSPDVSAGMQSTAYWQLMAIRSADPDSSIDRPLPKVMRTTGHRAVRDALITEILFQVQALEQARVELETLKKLAARPGLPVVYDTNMLNHWRQPDNILWRDVFRAAGQNVPHTRLIIPLRVIDELDRQKYGKGDLARKAATAIRFLERVLKDTQPGEPVRLRDGATLEIWVDTDDRSGDADLSILRSAMDLANLHRTTGVLVLTDDIGMRLRATQMGLKTFRLPEDHRKRGTALDEAPVQDGRQEETT